MSITCFQSSLMLLHRTGFFNILGDALDKKRPVFKSCLRECWKIYQKGMIVASRILILIENTVLTIQKKKVMIKAMLIERHSIISLQRLKILKKNKQLAVFHCWL